MTSPRNIFRIFAASLTFFPLIVDAQLHSFDYTTPAYIDVELGEVRVQEDQEVAVINLYRTGDFRQFTQLDFKTEEITAAEGKDYQGTGGTIKFQPGEGFKQIEIKLITDATSESDETFRVVLSNPSPNTLLMRNSTSVIIGDASAATSAPRLQIAAAGPAEILLSWEGDPTLALEKTNSANELVWQTVVCSPKLNGNRCEVIEPAAVGQTYYRLRSN